MRQDEKTLEIQCCTLARLNGWAAWKNEKNGNKGIPDDSFLHPDGRFYLIEFKKNARERLRPEQKTWSERFPNIVHRIDSLADFCALLEVSPPK